MTKAADIFYSFPRVIDLSLERMRAALNICHPRKSEGFAGDLGANNEIPDICNANSGMKELFPPIIHIAGTNGKGSTLAFLRAILDAAGKTCHVYTSPHLVTIHERFVVAGEMISEESLLEIALRVKEISKDIPLTIFEAETLAGFIAFSETRADYLLLETGLGGRLDATNAIEQKLLTIVTPIDYDHKEFLGEDLTEIAREKCGILRPNTPAIIARQRPELFDVFADEIEKIGANPFMCGQEWDSYDSLGTNAIQTLDRFLELPEPSLFGEHQKENSALASRAALLLGIKEQFIIEGIKSAQWPARMQPLNFGPLSGIADRFNAEVWLDGAHNEAGAKTAADFIAKLQSKDNRPFIMVCGMLNNKDHSGLMDAFKPLSPIIIFVPISSTPNSMNTTALRAMAEAKGVEALEADSFEKGFEQAVKMAKKPRVLICGSLYLAGEVLAH